MDLQKFSERYLTDVSFRRQAIAKLSDALAELGVDQGILSENVADMNALNTALDIDDLGKVSTVFIHKEDSDVNSTSIVVGMTGIEHLREVTLMREFQEFKAFKDMKLRGGLR